MNRPAMKSTRRILSVMITSLMLIANSSAQLFTSTTIESGRALFSAEHTSMAIVSGNPAVVYTDFSKGDIIFARNSAVDGTGTWAVSTAFFSYGTDVSLAIVDGKPAFSCVAGGQLVYVRNSAADGSGTWTSTFIESNTGSFSGTSLAVVNGKPAIAYYNNSLGDLKYAINNLSDGSGTWTKTTVDTGNGNDTTVLTGRFPTLRVVSGLPAISYYDQSNADLKFARNSAADGSGTWSITTVLATGFVGSDASMAIVDGRPAISFLNGSQLSFAINSLADGTGAWTVTNGLATSVATGYGTSMAVIGGNPVIGIYTFSGPRFVRNSAANATGAWTVINPAPSALFTSSIGPYPTVLEVDGKPAMVCADHITNDVRYMRNSTADASGTWTSAFIEDTGTVGSVSSPAIVSGNPVVAYFDSRQEDLKFARNSAADGSGTWTISTVDTAGVTGLAPSLKIIGGLPAISYYDDTNDDLKFAINSAADGSGIWTVTTVDATGNVGSQNSLFEVNGKPAIAYLDSSVSDLKFAINSAANGSGTWTLATVDTIGGASPSLAVVAGVPAISYGASGDLKLARNSAIDGSGTWTIITVDGGAPSVGDATSLGIVDGKPAIAYRDLTNFDLKYAICSTADGTGVWTLSIIDPNANAIPHLAVIGGKPSVAYQQSLLRYARNSAVDGSGAWALADATFAGIPGGLVELGSGQPGIAYFDSSGNSALKWAHLTATSFPEIEIEHPVGTFLSSGFSFVGFDSLVLGSNKTLTFVLKNVGTAPLTISTATLIGSHPGDYAFSGLPASLDPLQAAFFTVTFTPTTGGSRFATLRITNNDVSEATTQISFTGTCFLFTQDTDGDGISDAAEFNMSALGFNPNFNQSTTLVPALFNNANSIGLFTPSQLQALNVGTPLIQRNPLTGLFTLTIGVEKSTTLAPGSFAPFPMTAPQTTINGAGELEFQFTAPDDAAFYRLSSE